MVLFESDNFDKIWLILIFNLAFKNVPPMKMTFFGSHFVRWNVYYEAVPII